MHINKFTGLLVLLCCELCLTIKVPVVWTDSGDSAVNNEPSPVDFIQPQNVQTLHQVQSVPIEYFQYTAPKPQFAADIAAFHGVNNPYQHYKAYPIIPITGNIKPVLGIHEIINEDRTIYQPYQNYVHKTKEIRNIEPISTGYEIFHPYKAEEPALKEIYKDPVLTKIRDDIKTNKNRLQTYENDAGQANIAEDEYLEGEKRTDKKLFPQKNIPARYEIHSPERRPIYYNVPPKETTRDHILNQRFKHPWNQHNVKIRPVHYKPLKNHIHHLRQQHAIKYDDERNEYPQVIIGESTAEPLEGQEIYERGKEKYIQLRNNVDDSINKAIQKNRPAMYQNLEMQKDELEPKEEEDEFIPIKNYAQVRKTETYKHVPRKSALDDAETYEEILNAPRLREAVKSTKAQTVYSEEGYEDSAYDHAGEQKHASDHEGHGGFLKQNENSIGSYKTPTVLGNYQDGKGLEYRDKIEHGKKWKNNDKEHEEESEAEDYSETEHDESLEADSYRDKTPVTSNRNKREKENRNITDSKNTEIRDTENVSREFEAKDDISFQHDVDKREANFQVPKLNLDSTFLTEDEILEIAKLRVIPKKENIREKYPYYFKKIKKLHKNSPLRYAENLNFMPKKSEGGTEFYDSRSILECPEVDSDIDPIPQKLKSGENPPNNDEQYEDEATSENEFVTVKKQPRLKGLGDKIDCFRSKYFGKNPLDSPFFKELIISNPEPIIVPQLPIHEELNVQSEILAETSNLNNVSELSKKVEKVTESDIFQILDKLRTDKKLPQGYFNNSNNKQKTTIVTPQNTISTNSQQLNVYSDILKNINRPQPSLENSNDPRGPLDLTSHNKNLTYDFFQNKEGITKSSTKTRKRRSSFIYEPYKIIKDSQVQDSKKTTTSSNVSPLIKQLQSSKVVDRVSRSNGEDKNKQTRLGVSSRSYVDIGRKDRDKLKNNPSIVDVSLDQRRGEPRYEIRPQNHKIEYTPVDHKRAISRQDYKSHTASDNSKKIAESNNEQARKVVRIRQRTTNRPVYDVSPYLPPVINVQNVAESNMVKKTIIASTPQTVISRSKHIVEPPKENVDESEEEDDDDDVDDEETETSEELPVSSTTSTSPKPSFRRRTKATTTTENPPQQNSGDEPERLRLITRFRNYKPGEMHEEMEEEGDPTADVSMPKYREKQKKSSKSTLVTDTKKYGDDDDDGEEEMRKKEVDALIGVKQNMDDYIPLYEKEQDQKERKYQQSQNDNKEDSESNEDDEDGDLDSDSDDDDEDDEDDVDDDDIDSEDDDKDDEEYVEEEEEEEDEEPIITTPEPTKRTLVRTTEAPPSTMASHMPTTTVHETASLSKILSPRIKPIITRKKIEIHKELPVNKSLPHVTQFKQDIKEVEIIKEIPIPAKRKPQKKGEALELYKDDNLAKDINKLGDVEIFNDNIDIDKGRKHGGNYRKATKEDIVLTKGHNDKNIKPLKDAEASQSENQRHVEFNRYTPKHGARHGGNLKSIDDIKHTRNSGRSAKLVELSNTPVKSMRVGKTDNRRREGRRNEKLIEFDDSHEDEKSPRDDDYKSSSHNTRTDRLHGGNYRSAKLITGKDDENGDIRVRSLQKDNTRNSAALLSSFVQAVPVLTTTPGYILDPSKRMYYYVEP